ncbi:hypothetical protein HZB90_01080 [archaeon]|nr:hypothetical protein [archaeon]
MSLVKQRRILKLLLKDKRGMVAETSPEPQEPPQEDMPPERTQEPFPTEPAENAATPTEAPSGPKE